MAACSSSAENLWLLRSSAAALLLIYRYRKRKSNRKLWVRDVFLERHIFGDFHSLVPKIKESFAIRGDPLFVETFRMTPRQMEYFISLVGPLLVKKTTHLRKSISPQERLCITLRFLATGDIYRSISLAYRIGKSTVSVIIPETCKAIWTTLQAIYLSPPNKIEMCNNAEEFFNLWNFPNCLGAIDGKHVVLVAPPNGGSVFYNYKGSHSIVLMASCDAKYRFTHIDVGNYGRHSDGGVFGVSSLGNSVNDENFFPAPKLIPNHEILPHVFVADDAFPLKANLMKPYTGRNLNREKRIFNYRLSRARRCIENAFGILAARWRVLRGPMSILPKNATLVVQGILCLHNFLMCKDGEMRCRIYCPHGFSDYSDYSGNVFEGEWRKHGIGFGMENIPHQGSNMHRKSASDVRDSFTEYFNSTGIVSWQNKFI